LEASNDDDIFLEQYVQQMRPTAVPAMAVPAMWQEMMRVFVRSLQMSFVPMKIVFASTLFSDKYAESK
jgi:hypothetical protein